MRNKFKEQMKEAKRLINKFVCREYGDEQADFVDIQNIPIAYTETEDGDTIQVYADLRNFAIRRYLNQKFYDENGWSHLDAFIQNDLQYLDFDSLVRL